MAIILSIETSTADCSVALHHEGQLMSLRHLPVPQSTASQLSVEIDRLFAESKIDRSDLAAVAVAAGPGSYTGLRIGVSTAKGICFGLGLPLIAMDSLMVLAYGAGKMSTDWICPMIDARRMEVYYCMLDQSFRVLESSRPKVMDESSFAEELATHTICFVGEATEKCRPLLTRPNARFAPQARLSARHMGNVAFEHFRNGQFEDLASFEPQYLKAFAVKTKIQKEVL